jgi:hypothetical protein
MTRYPVPRIVRGGQTSGDSWAIYDRRTKELLAQGDTGLEEYDAAAERQDPEEVVSLRPSLGRRAAL